MANSSEISAKVLQRRYRLVLILGGSLILLAVAAYGWAIVRSERAAMLSEILGQSEQLRTSIEDTLDVAQSHVAGMRRSVERSLAHPDLADPSLIPRLQALAKDSPPSAPLQGLPNDLKTEVGALHVDPVASIDKQEFQRDVAAASGMLNLAVSAHAWHRELTWSYFYDAQERWWLIYPPLEQSELLAATATTDLTSAFKVIFSADGTYPVSSAGPLKNPKRDLLWTPPYVDAGGKGMMVTLLAPVYRGDAYIGAVGSDVTLQTLDSVLQKHPVPFGRAWIVDTNGLVVADSGGSLQGATASVKLTDVLSGAAILAPPDDDAQWNRLPLRGTYWTLLVYVPQTAVQTHLYDSMRGYISLAMALMVAMMGLAWVQNRRYAYPALQLAEYMDLLESQPAAVPPKVPQTWTHWFEDAARAALERQRLWAQAQANAFQLEETVQDRTSQLSAANEELTSTIAQLTRTQQEMERSQRALQQSNESLARLSEIGTELTSQLDSDHVFETIHKALDGLLAATSFRITLLDPDGKGLSSAYGMENGKRLGPLYVPLTDSKSSFVTRCYREKEEIYFQSISHDFQKKFHVPGTLETQSALFYPLLVGEEVIGVMTVQSVVENAYSETDRLVFRTLCASAAIALNNAMTYAKLRETQRQLADSEKFAALGNMVVGVAHELNTPVGNALLVASSLEADAMDLRSTVDKGELKRGKLDHFLDNTRQATQLLQTSLNKAASLVRNFKRVAEDTTAEQRRPFDLAVTTHEVLSTLAHRIDTAGHCVEVDIPDGLLVDGYPGPYGELLAQMIENAVMHAFTSDVSGQIRIAARPLSDHKLEWTFSDNGKGIAQDSQRRIFDPFFTTRLGQGSNGLGLSISYNIATVLFGGQLTVQSQLGEGAEFIWRFPNTAPLR